MCKARLWQRERFSLQYFSIYRDLNIFEGNKLVDFAIIIISSRYIGVGICEAPNNEEAKLMFEPSLAGLKTKVLTGSVWHGPLSEEGWQKLNLCLCFVIKIPTTHSVCPLAGNPLRSHTWT